MVSNFNKPSPVLKTFVHKKSRKIGGGICVAFQGQRMNCNGQRISRNCMGVDKNGSCREYLNIHLWDHRGNNLLQEVHHHHHPLCLQCTMS